MIRPSASTVSFSIMVNLRILYAAVNSWYREERSFKAIRHSSCPETDAANRASIRQRAQKNRWASVRVYTVLWSHGSHLNNNCIDRRHSTFSCRAESMQQNNEHAEG